MALFGHPAQGTVTGAGQGEQVAGRFPDHENRMSVSALGLEPRTC